MSPEAKANWKERVLEELRSLSITVIYLWLLLTVFALHRQIVLARYQISYPERFGFAFINALILAKFMWLGEVLHAGRKAAGKALLFATLWNSAIFTAILMGCHILEEALIRFFHGQPVRQMFSESAGMTPWDIFATALLIFVVLIPFFLVKGLMEILGKNEVKRLLFSPGPGSSAAPEKDS